MGLGLKLQTILEKKNSLHQPPIGLRYDHEYRFPFFLEEGRIHGLWSWKNKCHPDHLQTPTSAVKSLKNRIPFVSEPRPLRKFKAAFMLNLFSLRNLPWGSSTGGQKKVELTSAEVESLRSELTDIEEREAHLKAQLEHIDEILRSAHLSGYLYFRTRWSELPGDPPPIDDSDVDDWLPRFIVLHGACIFIYLLCTDLTPQDSTLLSDIIEVGRLPSFKREDEEIRYAFYILTRQGLRYECSSSSKIQVDSWLTTLQTDSKLEFDTSVLSGSIEM